MNTQELMINDLVKVHYQSEYYTVKVLSVNDNGTFTAISIGNNKFPFETQFENINLHPIPLTEETLIANGFKKYQENNNAPYYFVSHFSIRHHNTGYFYAGEGGFYMDFHYIHELQHALRLCELNDLANNFRLK